MAATVIKNLFRNCHYFDVKGKEIIYSQVAKASVTGNRSLQEVAPWSLHEHFMSQLIWQFWHADILVWANGNPPAGQCKTLGGKKSQNSCHRVFKSKTNLLSSVQYHFKLLPPLIVLWGREKPQHCERINKNAKRNNLMTLSCCINWDYNSF